MDNVIATEFSFPPYFLQGKVVVINHISETGALAVSGYKGVSNQFPLKFNAEGLKEFVFPFDPWINIGFKNIITRRTVAKGSKRGTVKERWTEDDADINISGVFMSSDGTYPKEVKLLQEYFELHKSIDVTCPLLNDKGIYQIAIESLEFNHTKGIENQSFGIKAYSDDVFNFLVDQSSVPFMKPKGL